MKSESSKKLYKTPELVVYGDLREVTQTVGDKSKVEDGGSGKNSMTN